MIEIIRLGSKAEKIEVLSQFLSKKFSTFTIMRVTQVQIQFYFDYT